MNAEITQIVIVSTAAAQTIAAVLISIKAARVWSEAEKRRDRLERQSAEIEAEREASKQTIAALRALLSHQPLFGHAREFLEIRGGN